MSDFGELYSEVILDHAKSPRNFGPLPGADRTSVGHNPLCGDKLRLDLKLADGVITDVKWHGEGCAISSASASMMTTVVKGRARADIERLFERFHAVLTGKESPDPDVLGKLASLAGVADFPVRVKCATLAWHTLMAALEGEGKTVSTEET